MRRNPGGEMILSAFAPYIVGAVVLFFLYKKSGVQVPNLEQVKTGLKDIKTGLPGAVGNVISGTSDKTYITAEQARAKAAAELAKKKTSQAGPDFPPFLYGIS